MKYFTNIQIARFIISFSWLYHGLIPKLIHIAPLELKMTASFGFNAEISTLITRAAGIGEMIFAVLFFIFYRSILLNILNIAALVGLMLFVAVLQPTLLIEAFNPVTTNLAMIAFSLVLIKETKEPQLNA
ncbi:MULTISPECIES: DoxX-like family protein [unclassified Pseudoalteromonas]|uniref:DoxX-like family protein n=1 Tax=unclassified Pseudoalteromonas TaxID=194690 RepID=UPI001EF09AE0|nr:DoxX-like family protein [Pseudoalteromonas sp. L21]MCF7517957.1 DoxX-like family protein [Pseudoalteromonas sp. L21]UJX27842.1 DoxX-like family protein [Pseudoalteromonas sp. CF6-2]